MEFLQRPEGASQDDLALLSREYLVFLPHDLRSFMIASNGPILWFGFKELQFLQISDILRDDYAVRTHMQNGLPLCMDGNSNMCIAKIHNHQIIGYYVARCGNLDWDDAVKLSDTFTELLADSLSPEQRVNA